jgi:hypothetical protein
MKYSSSITNSFKKHYVAITTVIFIGSLLVLNWESIVIHFQILRVEAIIRADDMGWSDDVKDIIKDLKESSNKRHLAEILLSQSNGSLVAEGMVVVVEERFSDGDKILNRYAMDKRWNYWLSYNNDFSQASLLAWKIKMNKPLTISERKFLSGWQNILDATFKIERY